jgi:DMSO reductase anchor subunit
VITLVAAIAIVVWISTGTITTAQQEEQTPPTNQPTTVIVNPAITIIMVIAYSLLVVGVIWKLIKYMREKPNSRPSKIF